jgi:hypothetical protein
LVPPQKQASQYRKLELSAVDRVFRKIIKKAAQMDGFFDFEILYQKYRFRYVTQS